MNYGRYLENDNGCEFSFGINDYFDIAFLNCRHFIAS